MDRAKRARSPDASDEQETKRPRHEGGSNGGDGGGGDAGGGGGGDVGGDDSGGDAAGSGGDAGGGGGVDAGDHGSGGDVGGGGGFGHADDDRLSALGDDLLHAILSRLEARQTVRTCVLSKRWMHLWRSVPSLHIDQREFHTDDQLQSFTDFLLDHHDDVALLDEFRLHLSSEAVRLPACHWVRRVISRDDTPPYRLKRLHLCNVYLDNDFASHIGSDRCPALEDVQLINCSYLTTRYKITSSSLKKLVVDGFYRQDRVRDDESDDDDEVFNLIIEAPALLSLRLAGELDQIVDTTEPHTLPSLVDASVHLPVMTDEELEENDTTAHQSALRALFNVTSLTLSHFGLLFPGDSLELPVFANLRTLSLDECYIIGNDIVGLEPYLRHSPNLEKLTLRCSKVQPAYSLQWYFGREDQEDFTCENLRLTEIIYQQHDDDLAHLLVEFLQSMSTSLLNNNIELITVE